MLKIYQKYLINRLIKTFVFILFIFFVLIFLMGIVQELKFFSDLNVKLYFTIFLVFLNLPSILFEIIPFIMILSLMVLFLDLNNDGELITFKNNGLDNLKILKTLTITSIIFGLVVMILFYNISAILKFNYLSFKQNYTNDDKYLASITENGLWIKDEIDKRIIFINAKKIEKNYLENVDILILDQKFNYLSAILADRVDITENNWVLENPTIFYEDNQKDEFEQFEIKTNFNYDKINNLYSDLSSQTILGLIDLRKSYLSVNYSTTEIDYQIQKILTIPVYFLILSILSIIICLNFKLENKFTLIASGILMSVIIHYFTNFFGVMAKNDKISIILSIWGPFAILLLISTIGLIRINEK